MDYEKRYKEALERASKLRVQNPFDTVGQMVEHIFPELKESEDEKIRKEIVDFITSSNKYGTNERCEAWLNWLENQKSNTNKKEIDDAYLQGIWDAKHEIEKQSESTITNIEIPFGANDSELQEVSYYIPEGFYAEIKDDRVVIKKAEQKFKVGDCVIDNFGNIYQIETATEIESEHIFGYTIVGGGYFNDNSNVRLWTIQDAKDGDVLVTEDGRPFIIRCMVESENDIPSAYCGINARPNEAFIITGYSPGTSKWTNSKVHPATKEQRDLLFQKMKEAGYEWDTKKKELKKIEDKTLETRGNQVVSEIIKNQKEMPSEFTKLVHENFWDLIKTEHKMLDADKVIKWIKTHGNLFPIVTIRINDVIAKFKEDFGL